MILILSPSANFCNKVLTSDKKSAKFVAGYKIYDIFQRQICYEMAQRQVFAATKVL